MDFIATSVFLSGAFNSVTNIINGKLQRDLQRDLHGQDRADAADRFGQDIDLRRAQFVFSQSEAETARARRIAERTEDFERLELRDRQARSFNSLSRVFLASPDGWYVHDPYAHAHPGVKSLRVLLQRPKGLPEQYQIEMEHEINAAIKAYSQSGAGHPIHFPTGVWADGAQPGSWVASELHAWDQNTPTLILRIAPSRQGGFYAEADLFGFPMGDQNFQQNIELGHLPNDPQAVARVLSLVALGASDVYFLNCYARAPLLPHVLGRYLPPPAPLAIEGPQAEAVPAQAGAVDAVISEMVAGYRQTVNVLMRDTPEVGIYAALQLAEALTAFPDKSHAVEQLREVEARSAGMISRFPQLGERLKALYVCSGAEEDAARIEQEMKKGGNASPAEKRNRLEAHI